MFAKNGWYCVAFGSEIGDEPLARHILDIPILLARAADGQVHALHDRCPHRFAPLHLGKRIGETIQCPYHGLRFDLSGTCVFNPHGDGRIPAAAKVASFPVVEAGHFVWLWPGDPALADPADIPDTLLLDMGEREPVCGHLQMPVNYQLVIDNLLDLSHAAYLHAGTLSPARGNDPKAPAPKRSIDTQVSDRSIMVRACVRDVAPPLSQALYCGSENGDFHSQIEWIFPGTLRHGLSFGPVDAGFDAGVRTRLVHLITPETETSSHYFWFHTRSALQDDDDIDTKTHDMIVYAFTQEDEPMIQACQERMNGEDFFALKPLFLDTDLAGTRCRRIMERIIGLEKGKGAGEKVPDTSRQSENA